MVYMTEYDAKITHFRDINLPLKMCLSNYVLKVQNNKWQIFDIGKRDVSYLTPWSKWLVLIFCFPSFFAWDKRHWYNLSAHKPFIVFCSFNFLHTESANCAKNWRIIVILDLLDWRLHLQKSYIYEILLLVQNY